MRHRFSPFLGLLGLLAFLALSPALAESPAPLQPADVERLTHLAKLWGTIRFLHPYLAYKEIDWDAALVRAIPAVRSARTPQEYAAAAQGMLAALGDPVTRVEPSRPPVQPPAAGKPPALFTWLSPGRLSIYLRPDADSGMTEAESEKAFQSLAKELPRAREVIVDLRSLWGLRYRAEFALQEIAGALASRPVPAPAERFLVHSGYRTQLDESSGGYSSGFQTPLPELFAPPAGALPKRVVFLVNADTVPPPVAAALQAAGDGAIVSEGRLSEDGLVHQKTIDLGEGFVARVRISEILPQPGWTGLRADAVAASADSAGSRGGDPAFAAALGLLHEWPKPVAGAPAALPIGIWRPDRSYGEMTEPTLEFRLLAAFKLWTIFHDFFPYFHLTGDWDPVLPELITRMEGARDGREYALALAEMAARANDGHVSLTGNPTLDALYGKTPAPVAIRWIENAWVVTAVGEAARGSGVEVGDIVLTLDGEPVAAREATLRRYLAASTEAGMRRKVADRLLSGPDGSPLTLTVRGRGDQVREVRLKRGAWTPNPAGETVRVLPGNLGYADLTRLTEAEVEGMFERVKGTRALILDMRGYPNGTAWSITPYLNTRGATAGPLFRGPQVSGLYDERSRPSLDSIQPLPSFPVPAKYTGRTVMLIDERTVSQAEHSGLFFEAANGTRFIGSQTAGANGDVTYFTLPGIASVRFSGHDVRHADGRQLQRIGLVPDVPVAPTIQGIRDGKDEVLDRAVRYLMEELGALGGE
jgi:C-terminal processing protease CtpA/Prc